MRNPSKMHLNFSGFFILHINNPSKIHHWINCSFIKNCFKMSLNFSWLFILFIKKYNHCISAGTPTWSFASRNLSLGLRTSACRRRCGCQGSSIHNRSWLQSCRYEKMISHAAFYLYINTTHFSCFHSIPNYIYSPNSCSLIRNRSWLQSYRYKKWCHWFTLWH
jgi:hypothetical protein